jgi:hypothetical protein
VEGEVVLAETKRHGGVVTRSEDRASRHVNIQ